MTPDDQCGSNQQEDCCCKDNMAPEITMSQKTVTVSIPEKAIIARRTEVINTAINMSLDRFSADDRVILSQAFVDPYGSLHLTFVSEI